MITSWHELEKWIEAYGLNKWTVTRSDPSRRSDNAGCDKLVDTALLKDASLSDKLDHTRRTLELYGDRCYIQGYTGENATRASVWNEICLTATPAAPAIGLVPQPTVGAVDEAAITERIRKELQMDFDRREYERERKELDRERKLFDEQKNGVLGALVGYISPYLPALNKAMGMRQVAGLDAENDVEAAKINALDPSSPNRDAPETQEEETESPFTDEEAEVLLPLMKRFKAVEPHYLRLLESVVELAESGDATYTMARGILLK